MCSTLTGDRKDILSFDRGCGDVAVCEEDKKEEEEEEERGKQTNTHVYLWYT